MKYKLIQVHYLDGKVIKYENESLEKVTSEIFEDPQNRDPDKIELLTESFTQRNPHAFIPESKITLQWNPSLFHYCFAHGRLTEHELIEKCKV